MSVHWGPSGGDQGAAEAAGERARESFRDPKHAFSPSASNPELCWKCKCLRGAHWQEPLPDPYRASVAAERARCAVLVRAAGCNCDGRAMGGELPGFIETGPFGTQHFADCPFALAAAIEAGP